MDHHDNFGSFSMRVNTDGTAWVEMSLPDWTYHGWIMVGAWTVLSVL